MCTRSKRTNIILVILFFIFFIIFSLIIFSTFEEPKEDSIKKCRKDEFNCNRNNEYLAPICIEQAQTCNQKNDCPEGQDEDESFCEFHYFNTYYGKPSNYSHNIGRSNIIVNTSTISPFDETSTTINYKFNLNNETLFTIEYNLSKQSTELTTIINNSSSSFNKNNRTNCDKAECDFNDVSRICCSNLGLKKIPINLTSTITIILLNKNNLTHLDRNSFFNLTYLEIIGLNENQIKEIDEKTFSFSPIIRRIFLNNNQLVKLPKNLFNNLTNLQLLEIRNNRLKNLNFTMFSSLQNLFKLELSSNEISLTNQIFPYLPLLTFLHLGKNKIEHITEDTFKNLPSLHMLELKNNKIKTLSPYSFRQNLKLGDINLNYNQLEDLQLSSKLFENLTKLSSLGLSYNLFNHLPQDIFYNNLKLYNLELEGLPIYNISFEHFNRLKKLSIVHFPHFRYCLFVPEINICKPFTDRVSSLKRLIALPPMRLFVWSFSFLVIILNFTVLFLRTIDNQKYLRTYVKLLSISDSLIGFYMLAIGWFDYKMADNYQSMALEFVESWHCTGLGALAVFSKQFSLVIVLFISYDRYKSVLNYSHPDFTVYSFKLVIIGFLFSLFISLFPIVYWLNQKDIYFGANLLCYPLHLSEPFLIGWQFNAFVILINLPIILIIIFLYAHMFYRVKQNRHKSRPVFSLSVSKTNLSSTTNEHHFSNNLNNQKNVCKNYNSTSADQQQTATINLTSNNTLTSKKNNHHQEDYALALRLFFIVITDCICWLPIIFTKMAALANFKIPAILNAWIIILILPINALCNPIIYTIATPTRLRVLFSTSYSILKKKLMNLFKLKTTKRRSIHLRQSSDSGDFRTSSGSNLNSINQNALNSPLSSSQMTMECLDRKSSNEQDKFYTSCLDLDYNNNNNENLISISQSLIKSSITTV